MYVEAELVFDSYIVKELEPGMLFLRVDSLGPDNLVYKLFYLENIPDNQEKFLVENGMPVIPKIIIKDESDRLVLFIVDEENLAWIDLDEDDEDLYEATLEHYNFIINEYFGLLEIDVDEEEDFEPIIIEDKVIIRFLTEEEEEQ